jgi:AraC-like DNA-binding protein
MPYQELPTTNALVACLWTRTDGEPAAQRVLPDACVDIVWTGAKLVVAGPATQAVTATTTGPAFGVRFRVGAAGAALGVPAAELLDLTVPLADIWGDDGDRIADAVAQEPTLDVLARAVADRIAGADADRLVRAAATGTQPNIGDRQLRRRFAEAVGYGPKTLQRILRFQRFLALAEEMPTPGGAGESRGRPDLARFALDAGYADQAHLTRECTRLAGLPPAQLLAAGAGPAGERSVSFKIAGPVAATLAA